MLSGGDPLMLPTDRLDYFLGQLRAIPHIEFMRIGTRIPSLPAAAHHAGAVRDAQEAPPGVHERPLQPPRELTPRGERALRLLADAGVPLGSQTVLLKGVNDDPRCMKRLCRAPPVRASAPTTSTSATRSPAPSHFRTSVEKGLEIIEALRGLDLRAAVPHFVIDAPGGGGKIPLLPHYVQSVTEREVVLRNYAGKTFRYVLPKPDAPSASACD